MGNILGYPALSSSDLVLMDVDAERLRTSKLVAEQVAATLGATPTITATTDRTETVGLCHSVPLTARDLCEDIGVPLDEVR